jgi:predicted Zn-dependent protease
MEERFVRFAGVGPTQSGDRERIECSVRVRFRQGTAIREARASAGSLDPADLDAALERALGLAEIAEPDEEAMSLGGAVDVPETASERPTLDHTFREKAEWVKRAVEACRAQDLEAAGLVQTTGVTRALASSAGRAVRGATTRASFALTAGAEDKGRGSGYASQIASNAERIDPKRVVRRAVEKAIAARAPRQIDPGEYTVILEPEAVAALMLFPTYCGFGAQEVHEESSFLCGRMGEKVFPDLLTVVDDASGPENPGVLFDGEGTPRRAMTLIDRGRITGPVTDARWAERMRLENSGHGLSQPTTSGPRPSNLCILAGRSSLEQMIARVDRGLLVTQFHYTNLIEPRELTLTGMTRNGTFLIEGGRVVGAVHNLRFTQSLVQALARVSAVGEEGRLAGALFDGEVYTPALRIDGFRFTSATEF